MKHEFTQRIYFSDTDAYGVVWHGSYLRWMEMGRVELCSLLGLDLLDLKEKDIAFPVTNINIRYKSSAKLDDKVVIKTSVTKVTPLYVTFSQQIINRKTEQLHITADVDVVAVNNEGKLYRRLPEELKTIFEGALECQD